VMSLKYLGEHLDIHAGGNDLVFPHHENEIAQAEATTGKPFFRFWMHNGMLAFQEDKMSKSVGNVAQAWKVLNDYGPETIRYFFLSHHYRKPMDYSVEGLQAAGKALARIQTLVRDVDAEFRDHHVVDDAKIGTEGGLFLYRMKAMRAEYVAAMDDDLNTVAAIGVLQDIVTEANLYRGDLQGDDRLALPGVVALIRELADPLGLFPDAAAETPGLEGDLIGLLIALRDELRDRKEFELADRIRDRLGELGVVLKDGPSGTIWTTG